MTRKRFKKLLMAHGYQSREAEYAALCALGEYGEYRLAWKNKWHALAVMRRQMQTLAAVNETLRDSFRAVIESILIPMAERIRENVRPMFEALKDALKEGSPYE